MNEKREVHTYDFHKWGYDAFVNAMLLDKQSFDKGLEQGKREMKYKIAQRVNLEGIKNALEKGFISQEKSESEWVLASILVDLLEKE